MTGILLPTLFVLKKELVFFIITEMVLKGENSHQDHYLNIRTNSPYLIPSYHTLPTNRLNYNI